MRLAWWPLELVGWLLVLCVVWVIKSSACVGDALRRRVRLVRKIDVACAVIALSPVLALGGMMVAGVVVGGCERSGSAGASGAAASSCEDCREVLAAAAADEAYGRVGLPIPVDAARAWTDAACRAIYSAERARLAAEVDAGRMVARLTLVDAEGRAVKAELVPFGVGPQTEPPSCGR